MNLQELKTGFNRELDMMGDEAAALKGHVQEGLSGLKAAAGQAAGDAEKMRAKANEEIRQARKYVDERFGGASLGAPQSTENTQ